ncbi:MAG: sialidase family protein, partial [Acidobacteriota bacterium]
MTVNDQELDAENSMATVLIGTTDRTAIGNMKLIYGPDPKSREDDLWRNYVNAVETGETDWTRQAMPHPADYQWTIDPVLHVNVFSDGVAPKRMYYAGVAAQVRSDQVPNAVVVWHSDDGGKVWSNAVEVIRNNDPAWFIDKPDIEVSWYSGTRGFVYVSYMRLSDPDVRNNELYVARSGDGGVNWTTPVRIVTGRIQAPQVVVNPFTGRVYCIYIDMDADQIKMSFSDDNGVNWSQPETAASGPLKNNQNRYVNGKVTGFTIPQARFDNVNNRLIVTWAEAEWSFGGTHNGGINSLDLVDTTKDFSALGVSAGDYVYNETDDSFAFVESIETTINPNDTIDIDSYRCTRGVNCDKDFDTNDQYTIKARATDIYYTAKYTSTQWLSKVRLDVPLTNDQFQPSIDFSSTGDLLVGYYDRSADPANNLYEARWIKFDKDGNKIVSGLIGGSFQSDPSDNGTKSLWCCFVGDYSDTWFWTYGDVHGERFHFVFHGDEHQPGVTKEGDIYAAAIQ